VSALPAVFDLATLAGGYRARRFTPQEIALEALARTGTAAGNPIWIHRASREELLAQADALTALAAPGSPAAAALPLYGVPFAVKDNIDVAGMPTTAACPAFTYSPDVHAGAVAKLIAAGALVVGKTNLDQFATGLVGARSPYGTVRNSFDARYISGGSSSGSGVAVSLGQVAFALGTDTAGSGRVPAAFNSIVGLKPTRGLVSNTGMVPACRSLDCVSVFALSCGDAVQVLDAMAGFDADDPYSRPAPPVPPALPPENFRFAIPLPAQQEFFGDAAAQALFAAAIKRLQALGGRAVEADFGPFFAAQELLYGGPWIAERTAELGAFLEVHPGDVHPVTRQVIESGLGYSAVDAFRAQYRLAALKRAAEPLWETADLLLVPGAPTIYTIAEVEADPVTLNSRLGIYTNFVNLLDLAALTVPAGLRPDGLPFGVTLIGPAFSDHALAALGARLHAAGCATAGACRAPVPAAAALPAGADANAVRVAVVGAHLSGMPLNAQLTSRGARLVRAARTAPRYRLYALTDQLPPKPGLVHVGRDGHGASIDVEVWELPVAGFGALVADIPAPLGIGTLTLEDGETVKGFLCEPYATAGREDITAMGGWRKFTQLRLQGA
jgi:allophanate hydrolase